MQTIETYGKINNKGILAINKKFLLRNKKVKVIVLVPEEDVIDDDSWLRCLSENPAFDFLKDEEEDIYTISDGKPFNYNEI